MRQLVLVALVVLAFAQPALGSDAPVTVFRGRPQVRLNETGEGQSRSAIPREQASNFDCIISKIGDRYFWATRENREVIRSVSGVFATFHAVDGSGYVRYTVSPLGIATQAQYDYVEHVLLWLGTVTYYGHVDRNLPTLRTEAAVWEKKK